MGAKWCFVVQINGGASGTIATLGAQRGPWELPHMRGAGIPVLAAQMGRLHLAQRPVPSVEKESEFAGEIANAGMDDSEDVGSRFLISRRTKDEGT